jgi:hypothetical protein
MRSIQNRSRKIFEKYACFAYVDHQTLGHDRKKSHPKKFEKNFSTDLDVSDYGESKSAMRKNRQKKHPSGHFSVARKKNVTIIYMIYMCMVVCVKTKFPPNCHSPPPFTALVRPILTNEPKNRVDLDYVRGAASISGSKLSE